MSITYYVTSPRGQEEPSNRRNVNGLRIPVTTWPTDEMLVGAVLISPDEVHDADPWEFEISLLELPSHRVLARSPILTPDLAESSQPDRMEFEPLLAVLIVMGHFRTPNGYELAFTVNGNRTHTSTLIVEQRGQPQRPRRYPVPE